MISQLFSSPLSRRLLCCLLALATVCLCLAPALVQPALALAGVDDATLAVGLLFCSWAGITFATNQGAATAVGSFLNSSVNGLKACSEVASKYVVDGSLALVQGVKDAFNSILPDINTAFKTDDDSIAGVYADGVSLGVSYPLPVFQSSDIASSADFSMLAAYAIIPDSNSLSFKVYVNGSSRFGYSAHTWSSAYGTPTGFFVACSSSGSYSLQGIYTRSNGSIGTMGFSGNGIGKSFSDAYLVFSSGISSRVDFQRSKEIDGTQIQEITFAPGGVWDPSPDDPTQPDMSQWPGLSLAALLAILANQNSNNPNLDPEKMIEELRKLLQQQTDPDPDPEPDPDPNPDPSDPDTPSGGDDFGQPHSADWKNVFPFCVPFDLIDFLGILAAEPEAPKFTWRFYAPPVVDEEIEIDLSVFDTVASVMRTMELLAFCVGLILLTRNIIRG